MLLRRLEGLSTELGSADVVLCGDFNSTPDSGLYQLLAKGSFPPDHTHAAPADPALPAILAPAGLLLHGLGLCSAYAMACGAEPTATNVKGPPENFAACLDYIFASARLGPPVATLRVPPISELVAEGGGLPNSSIPSDHVPIGAVYSLAGPQLKTIDGTRDVAPAVAGGGGLWDGIAKVAGDAKAMAEKAGKDAQEMAVKAAEDVKKESPPLAPH